MQLSLCNKLFHGHEDAQTDLPDSSAVPAESLHRPLVVAVLVLVLLVVFVCHNKRHVISQPHVRLTYSHVQIVSVVSTFTCVCCRCWSHVFFSLEYLLVRYLMLDTQVVPTLVNCRLD